MNSLIKKRKKYKTGCKKAMKKWFCGKNIIISGASSGIGFQMAKIFATKYNCNVVGIGRTESKLIKAKQDIDESINTKKSLGSFNYYLMDVCDIDAWGKLRADLNASNFKVDMLINNAGVFLTFNKFENQDLETCKKVIDTNFYSSLYSYNAFVNDLKSNNGSIVFVASSAALCPVVGTAVYSASKGALKNFAEALAEEHKKEMFISCVFPGYTLTDLFRNEKELGKFVLKFAISSEKMAKKIIRKLAKKKKRIVVGKDAHLMSGLYRLSPRLALSGVTGVLKASKDKMFEKVFDFNKKSD